MTGILLIGAATASLAEDTTDPGPLDKLNLFTPQMQALRDNGLKTRNTADKEYQKKLADLVAQSLAKTDAALEEKQKLGNVKGVAIAREARKFFEQAQADLTAKNDFSFPSNARKEVQPLLDECLKKKSELETPYTTAMTEWEANMLREFTALAQQQLQQFIPALTDDARRQCGDGFQRLD